MKIQKKKIGRGGGGVRVDVNEEVKFFMKNSKTKFGGGGSGGLGRGSSRGGGGGGSGGCERRSELFVKN